MRRKRKTASLKFLKSTKSFAPAFKREFFIRLRISIDGV